MWRFNHTNELCHYGVKGQEWGVRRWQNEDKTRTAAGKEHEKTLPYKQDGSSSGGGGGGGNPDQTNKSNLSTQEKIAAARAKAEAAGWTEMKSSGSKKGSGKGSGKGSTAKEKTASNIGSWEKSVYDGISKTMANDPGKYNYSDFTDADDEEFKKLLRDTAGVNTDNMSDLDLEKVRKRMESHYKTAKISKNIDEWGDEYYSKMDQAISEGKLKSSIETIIGDTHGEDDLKVFKSTLSKYAGISVGSMSDHEINEIRKKVRDHYYEKSGKTDYSKDGPGVQKKKLEVAHSMDYIEHHGILGQKWGVRRYQTINGTYTEEGKARRRSFDADAAFKPGKDGKPSPAEKAARGASSIVSEVNNIRDASNRMKNEASEAHTMTDAELQAAINRMNLEKRYRDLKAEEIAYGQTNVMNTLAIIGSVTAIGASAASIATAVNAMRK